MPPYGGGMEIYMKDLTKKVVILNNFSSPYICEAIIVLKDYNPKLEGRVIDEAERVVAEYLENHTVKKEHLPRKSANARRRKNRPHLTAAVLISLAALAAAGVFYFIAR